MKERFLLFFVLIIITPFVAKSQETASKSLIILNATGGDLVTLFVSAPDAVWGANKLTNGRLPNGKFVTIKMEQPITACLVDILAETQWPKVYQLWELNICENNNVEINKNHEQSWGSTTYVEATVLSSELVPSEPSTKQSPGKVSFLNRTGFTLEEVYIYQGTDGWGEDWLGDETMNTDRDRTFDLSGEKGCLYNVRALDEDGDIYNLKGQNLCENKEIVLTLDDMGEASLNALSLYDDTATTSVQVFNEVKETIHFLFSRIAREGEEWSIDLLGGEGFIAEGQSQTIEIPLLPGNACRFDVKATNMDASAVWLVRDIDLCTEKELRITEEMYDPTEVSEGIYPMEPTPDESFRIPDKAHRIWFENFLRKTIFYLHIRPSQDGNSPWGSDRLAEDNALSPREIVEITIPELLGASCRFDIRGLDLKDQEVFFRQGVDLCTEKTVRIK